MENPCGCDKKYYASLRGLQVQLNAIQMTGNIDAEMQIIFPNPWMLLGFVQTADLPNDAGSPVYPSSQVQLLPATTENFSDLLTELFIAFMQANQLDDNLSDTTRYVSGQFRYYFNKYMNEGGNFPQNKYKFLMPPSMIMGFWADLLANPSNETYKEVLELTKDIFKVSDKRLWGAPGTYVINPQVDPEFWISCPCPTPGTGAGTSSSLITLQDPPNIEPADSVAYFFINTDGDDNDGVIFGSNSVPYAGAGPANPSWGDFIGEPMKAILAWVRAVLLAETGDAEGPATYQVAQVFDIPTCEVCNLGTGLQITITALDAYTFGTLALDPVQKFVRFLFSETFVEAPYWRRLTSYVDDNSALPFMLVAELKTTE